VKRFELRPFPSWYRSALLLLSLAIVFYAFYQARVVVAEGGDGKLALIKTLIPLLLPLWIIALVFQRQRNRSFLEIDETRIRWRMEGSGGIVELPRAQITRLEYKPFTLKIETSVKKYEIELSFFPERSVLEIRRQLDLLGEEEV
jgi:hypothetical protein